MFDLIIALDSEGNAKGTILGITDYLDEKKLMEQCYSETSNCLILA